MVCYFLIIAAIIEGMIVEDNQYKFKEQEIQNLRLEQMDWIHKELNQECESNDIEDIKITLHSLDSKLYLLLKYGNSPKEEAEQNSIYQDFCHDLGDLIRENHFKIEDIPQELRLIAGTGLYRKAYLQAREHADVERYIIIFHLLLNDINSLKEDNPWTRSKAISLFVDELINGLDLFEEDERIVDFLYKNKVALENIGIFYDPNDARRSNKEKGKNHGRI